MLGEFTMRKKFGLTEEEEKQFNEFLITDEFAEALAIAWRFGAKRKYAFSIRNKRKWIPQRFNQLITRSHALRYNESLCEKNCNWEVGINLKHPFVQTIKDMGWTPITEGNRVFPKGHFNEKVFVSMYIRLLHEVGTVKGRYKNKIYIRPRLRIHGSVDVLNNIMRVLHDELDIGMKSIQTDHKIEQAKTVYYQSRKEIPKILEFAGAIDSLEEFYQLELGYETEKAWIKV